MRLVLAYSVGSEMMRYVVQDSRLSIPLALLGALITACGNSGQPLEIAFDVRFGAEPLRCGVTGDAPALSDLRFFLHDIRLHAADGRTAPLALDPVPGWQSADVAFVDLEDGSGACLNGTAPVRSTVRGTAVTGDWTALSFTLGVPPRLNHGDPLTAEPPLTNSAMHWHWRSGYKFLRAGVVTADGGFWLHLGSARCHGVSGQLSGCDASNRPVVLLQEFSATDGVVVLDLERLFAGVNLTGGATGSCQMGPDEADCRAVLDALGIDPESGTALVPAASFRSAPSP